MSDDFLRPMPCSNDAERAVLSCALQWPDCIGKIIAQHGGERLFYIPANRVTWNALEKLHRERGEIDLITLTDELRRQGTLDQVGGPAHVAGLLDAVPSTQLLPQYLRSISEDARRREIITTCNQAANDAYNPASNVADLIQYLDNTVQRTFKSISAPKTKKLQTVILDTVDLIQKRMKGEGEIPGLSFGIPDLDEATNGAGPGEMIVLAARPGLGKTSLAIGFAAAFARQGAPVAIFSAEMLATQLGVRMLAGAAEIDSLRLAKGRIGKEEIKRLEAAVTKTAELPIWIDDRADMRLVDIQVNLRTLVKEHGIKVGVVDYLQLIKEPDGSRSREDAVRRLSSGLTNLGKELGIPMIVLAQLNRDSEKRGKPKQSDLRDSGSIEQDANKILLLNCENLDDDATILDMEILVTKCRDGRLGPVSVEFHRPFTTFKPKSRK